MASGGGGTAKISKGALKGKVIYLSEGEIKTLASMSGLSYAQAFSAMKTSTNAKVSTLVDKVASQGNKNAKDSMAVVLATKQAAAVQKNVDAMNADLAAVYEPNAVSYNPDNATYSYKDANGDTYNMGILSEAKKLTEDIVVFQQASIAKAQKQAKGLNALAEKNGQNVTYDPSTKNFILTQPNGLQTVDKSQYTIGSIIANTNTEKFTPGSASTTSTASSTFKDATQVASVLLAQPNIDPSGTFGTSQPSQAYASLQTQALGGGNGNVYMGSPAEQYFISAWQAINGSVSTAGAKAALTVYQSNGYQAINKHLWGSPQVGNALDISNIPLANQKQVKALDKYLHKTKAPFDMVVTRGASQSHPLYAQIKDLAVGETFNQKGVDSTKIDPNNTWGGSGIRIDYRIPQGASGAYYNAIPGYKSVYPTEIEWVMPAHAVWVLKEKTVDANGNMRAVMELVAQYTIDGKKVYG